MFLLGSQKLSENDGLCNLQGHVQVDLAPEVDHLGTGHDVPRNFTVKSIGVSVGKIHQLRGNRKERRLSQVARTRTMPTCK